MCEKLLDQARKFEIQVECASEPNLPCYSKKPFSAQCDNKGKGKGKDERRPSEDSEDSDYTFSLLGSPNHATQNKD